MAKRKYCAPQDKLPNSRCQKPNSELKIPSMFSKKTLADRTKMSEYKFIKTLANQKKSQSVRPEQLLAEQRDVSVRVNDHLIPCREVPIPRAPQAAPSIPKQKSSSPEVQAPTVSSPGRNTQFSFVQYLDVAWRDNIDVIAHFRDSINFHGVLEESSKQIWTANNADEDHIKCRSLIAEGPEQNAATMKDAATVKDFNPMWSWDMQAWSNALDMLNRVLEVGGQAMEVGGQQLLQRHSVLAEAKDSKQTGDATTEEDKSRENADATTEEGESTDSAQTSQCSDRHDDQKVPCIVSSSEEHETEPVEYDDITGQQKQSSDEYEEQKVEPITPSSAVQPCHGSDAFTWVRETMPVTASCQGPSESKEPVLLEALYHEMPRGLRKERNLRKLLKDESRGLQLFGKVVDPRKKTVSGMASPDLSQEDQDALKKMLQMWAPGPNQDDADCGDLTPGIGHDGSRNGVDAKRQKKSWAARWVPCRGKLPADSAVPKALPNNSVEKKGQRWGIFRFLSSHRRNM